MTRKKSPKSRTKPARGPAARQDEQALEGPPPLEAIAEPSEAQRQYQEELDEYTDTSPKLTAGDVDADWQRAAMSGEEAAGGSVATPDQDRVDEIGEALGVPQPPGEELRSTAEILEARDARRHRAEE
jgi:hypothetical protein